MLSFHYQMQAEASVISSFPAECPRGAPQTEFNSEQQDKNMRDNMTNWSKSYSTERGDRESEWVQSTAAEIQVQELVTIRWMDGKALLKNFSVSSLIKNPSGDESTSSAQHILTHKRTYLDCTDHWHDDKVCLWASKTDRQRENLLCCLLRKAYELLMRLILQHFYYRHEL